MGADTVCRMSGHLLGPPVFRTGTTDGMSWLFRLLRLCCLALLAGLAIYAPIHAYNQGRLAGYREGVAETLTKIVKSWPLMPAGERMGRQL